MDKQIVYDRKTHDFAMYLDIRLVGFRASYHAAELALDEMVFEALTHGDCATAAALDAPIDDDVPAPEPGDIGPDYEGPSPL
jgi:hypothetical protein